MSKNTQQLYHPGYTFQPQNFKIQKIDCLKDFGLVSECPRRSPTNGAG